MIDNNFVIKRGYLSRDHPDNRPFGRLHRYYFRRGDLAKDHPDRDTPVGKFYSYYYFCIAVGGKWIVWGMAIFAVLLFCAQIISVLTTGRYFRDNFLFAKMLAL